MPIPTLITDLSTTAASNYPAGSDSPSVLDDVQRAHGAFIAQLRDNPTANATTVTPVVNGGTGSATAAAARSALQVAQYGDADQIATVGGTADALTLAFTPAWTALNGGIFQFVAASDNATTTPTGNPNGLGAKTFIKGNNLALAPGDIKSGMTMLARYDSVLGKLALLNPFTSLIVETGSNANGSYTKWADGTMICEHRQTVSAAIGNAFTGGGFYSGGIGWTFPVPFVAASIPVCHVTAYGLASFGAVISTTPVNTDMQYVHLSIGSLGGTDRYAMLTAKGRWY